MGRLEVGASERSRLNVGLEIDHPVVDFDSNVVPKDDEGTVRDCRGDDAS
jgi:hypothetical protein